MPIRRQSSFSARSSSACVVHLGDRIHAPVAWRRWRDRAAIASSTCGQDDQDAVGAPGARFGHLIGVEHEVLAQHRQAAGGARARSGIRARPGTTARRSAPRGRRRRRPRRPGRAPADRSRRGSGPSTGDAFLISAISAGCPASSLASMAPANGRTRRRARAARSAVPRSGIAPWRRAISSQLVGGDLVEDVGHG